MPLLIFIILIVVLVIWWGRRGGGLTPNERQYLKRRGYASDDPLLPANPVTEDSRLLAALDALDDISANARLRAVQDLTKFCNEGEPDSRMFSPLIVALDDEDAAVRRAVAEALGKLKDARAIEPLKRRIEADDSAPFLVAARRAIERLESVRTGG